MLMETEIAILPIERLATSRKAATILAKEEHILRRKGIPGMHQLATTEDAFYYPQLARVDSVHNFYQWSRHRFYVDLHCRE